jgi:hypothetical protein
MKHWGFIQGRRIESSREYIVHSDELGVVAECPTLDSAWQALQEQQSKCKERGIEPHLAIFEWSVNCWGVSLSLYELMEQEQGKDPGKLIDLA